VIANFSEMLAHARSQVTRYFSRFKGESILLEQLSRQLFYSVEDIFSRSNMWGHITTSALVYDARADMVLVIYHLAYKRWLQPGGHHEGLEVLWVSALREGVQETGVDPCVLHDWHKDVDAPFDIDTHAIAARPEKNERAHVHHDFVYLFSGDSTRPLTPQLSEVKTAKWISREKFAQLPGARFARLGEKLAQLRAGSAPAH
jgi:ADP-ribose pyrophosphatase YjhB (NUDIX family)